MSEICLGCGEALPAGARPLFSTSPASGACARCGLVYARARTTQAAELLPETHRLRLKINLLMRAESARVELYDLEAELRRGAAELTAPELLEAGGIAHELLTKMEGFLEGLAHDLFDKP